MNNKSSLFKKFLELDHLHGYFWKKNVQENSVSNWIYWL